MLNELKEKIKNFNFKNFLISVINYSKKIKNETIELYKKHINQ